MIEYKVCTIDKLPKVQKEIYDLIKELQPVTISMLSEQLKRNSRSLSSVLQSLQRKNLVELKDHLFMTTDVLDYQVPINVSKPMERTDADEEHKEWLRRVHLAREEKLKRQQIAVYL